jgi:hypothetical protein
LNRCGWHEGRERERRRGGQNEGVKVETKVFELRGRRWLFAGVVGGCLRGSSVVVCGGVCGCLRGCWLWGCDKKQLFRRVDRSSKIKKNSVMHLSS